MPVRRALQFRRRPPCILLVLLLALAGHAGLAQKRHGLEAGWRAALASTGQAPQRQFAHGHPLDERSWGDSFGDGFPDLARLDRGADKQNFTRWLTFLAEALYYQPSPSALPEVQDCAALIRYTYRNALVAHTPAWRRAAGLAYAPGFGDISKFAYPQWPLGRGLFRTRAGPFAPADLPGGAFAEFADAATLLHYNTFLVACDLRAARAGDLLFFYQPEQREPYHAMLFVGRSHFQPSGTDWIVYHTGDLDGRQGEIRHVPASLLMQHPDPRWRPHTANPRFLGVYRFNLLR
jgi:uncharacterized protein YfaT (DUF1175 family)